MEWMKSSYSSSDGNCVEIAELPGGARAVRDSKNPDGGQLTITRTAWAAFANAVKTDRFE